MQYEEPVVEFIYMNYEEEDVICTSKLFDDGTTEDIPDPFIK